jgi:hypothetical protein
MEPLTAARLLAVSYWLLALPAGLRALEKGDFLEALLKTEDRGSSQWRALSHQLSLPPSLAHGRHRREILAARSV